MKGLNLGLTCRIRLKVKVIKKDPPPINGKVRYLCTATGCLGRPLVFGLIRVAIDMIDGDYGSLSICLPIFEGLQ